MDDEPTMAVLVTYFLTQITLFSNINQIASFVTMTFLLTFMVVNLACFLLKYSQRNSLLMEGCPVRQTFGQVSIIFAGIPHSLELSFRL
jgi:amino acid transporter